MKARPLIFCALLLSVLLPAAAQADVSELVQGDYSFSLNYDADSGTRGLSLDVNVAIAFFNFGYTLRKWDGAITGWNGRPVSSEFAYYYGVGLLNFIVIQRGHSSAGIRTRIHGVIPVSDNYDRSRYTVSKDIKMNGPLDHVMAITPFMEFSGGKKVFGVGLEILF